MSLKLYEAVAQLDTVNMWIEEHADEILANGGEMPPALEALLHEAEGTFAQKVERTALKVRELDAEADAIKVEANRLSQRAKTATNAAASLKAYLHRCLEGAGETTVKSQLVTVAIHQNPPRVEGALEPDQLAHSPYGVHVPESWTLDKAAVLAAHKAGTALPAGLSVTRGSSLRIR